MMATQRTPGFMTGLALLLPITLAVMASLFVVPIAPNMAQSFAETGRYTPGEIGFYVGWIITVPALFVALFSIPAGALGDRVGRRRLLIWSMAVYVVMGVLPFFLVDPLHILISRIGLGVVEAVLMTMSTTLIGDFFKGESRNRWLAAQTGTASIFAIFAIAIASVIGAEDWRNVFLLYLMPVLFLVLALLFTWEPEESDALAEKAAQGSWSDIPWGRMAIICAVTLFGGVMFYTVQLKLPVAFKELGVLLPDGSYDTARGGMMTAVASIFVPVGSVCFWLLNPRLSLKAMFILEFVLMATGFGLMSMLTEPWAFTFAAGLVQIGAGMVLPTLLTWAVASLPFATRGRGTGIWTATFTLSQFACNNAAIPLVTGFTGTILPAFAVLGWLCAGAAMIALFAPLQRSQPPSD
jgi:MFS family permease